MKTFLCFVLFLSYTVLHSQLKKVEVVDFYNWTANDGIHYQFIMAGEEPTGLNVEQPAVIRLRYSTDGGVSYKIVEYDATLRFMTDKNSSENLVAYLNGADTARIIEKATGYVPDNFILYYTKKGNFLKGFQADHTAMAKSEVEYAKVFITPSDTGDQIRNLIRLYYKSSDPLYRDLMVYAAQYD